MVEKKRGGEEVISLNFRVPVALKARVLAFRDGKMKAVFPGPVWSMTSVMIHLLDKQLTEEGF